LTPRIQSASKKFTLCCGFLIVVIGALFTWSNYIKCKPIALQFHDKLVIQNTDSGTRIIDYGFLNRKKSVDKFVDFELKPYLIAALGSPIIDEFIMLKPGSGSCATAAALCQDHLVKAIIMPIFEPFESKFAWSQFFIMQEKAAEHGIALHRISLKKAQALMPKDDQTTPLQK
jgi:hypothetical protein